MTWSDWNTYPIWSISNNFRITEWIKWEEMSEEDKKNHPEAYVRGGYLKKYTYHEEWGNFWETLSEEQRNLFKTLPNFDAGIFEEITGIKVE
jgi:hypothetical protein